MYQASARRGDTAAAPCAPDDEDQREARAADVQRAMQVSWPDWPEEPDRRCAECGRTRPHTIPRLNRPGRPVLCDECHAEVKK